MRVSFGVMLLTVSACGPITPIKQDGGSAGGSAGGQVVGGGFVTAGGQSGGSVAGGIGGGTSAGGTAGGASAGGSAGGAAGGSAGGSSAGGNAGGNAGGSADAGLGPFLWSNLVAQPPPTSLTFALAVSSRTGEAYVGMDNGRLYRSTGGPFAEVTGLLLSGLGDVHVTPTGKVFLVSGGKTAAHCLMSDCSIQASYVTVQNAAGLGTENFTGLCGEGERVFAIGVRETAGVGMLYEFDGVGAWTKVSNNLGISRANECRVMPSGEVIIVGDTGVARYDQGATTPEPIDLMGQVAASWSSIALGVSNGAIVEAFIAGGGSGSRYARRNNASGTWTSLPPIATGPTLNAIGALGPSEFLAAGTGTPKFNTWNGTSFVAANPAPPNTIGVVRDMNVTNPREVFLVGTDGAGSYSIIRGRR